MLGPGEQQKGKKGPDLRKRVMAIEVDGTEGGVDETNHMVDGTEGGHGHGDGAGDGREEEEEVQVEEQRKKEAKKLQKDRLAKEAEISDQ
jgi:hypothetical protein